MRSLLPVAFLALVVMSFGMNRLVCLVWAVPQFAMEVDRTINVSMPTFRLGYVSIGYVSVVLRFELAT